MNTSIDRDTRPFLPSDLARPDVALIRAATARFLAFVRNQPDEAAQEIVRQAWPRDMTSLLLVQRVAVSPTSTTSAAVLAAQAVSGFVASLAPAHAGARLIAAGLSVPLGRNATIVLPGVASYPDAPFVEEGRLSPSRRACSAERHWVR